MTSFRNKRVLGSLSVISLALLSYFLWQLSFQKDLTSPFYSSLIPATIYAFNLSIFYGWISFGLSGGLTITALSLMVTLFMNLKMDLLGNSILTLPFFYTALMGRLCNSVKNGIDQKYIIRSERLDEESNILDNEIKESSDNIYSLQWKLNRYSTLKEIAESLSTDLSLDDITKLIIDKTSKTLGKEGRILLYLVNANKQELMLSASKNTGKVKAKKGDVLDHWVLRHRKTLLVEDIVKDFRFSIDEAEYKKVFRSLIAAPLISEDKVIGVIRMDGPRELMYTQDDLRLLDIIADLGAVAMQNAILYSKTQELALKDGLTGLFVRRYFMKRLSEETSRAARNKGSLSVLLLDIDHFKDYNDKYGHTSGDLVLKHLAKIMVSMQEEGDVTARYGGEEIIMLLSGKNKDGAAKAASKIMKAIKEKPISLRRHETHITVSIGVASYPEDAMLEEELIMAADQRLYKAKAKGRDRVCLD